MHTNSLDMVARGVARLKVRVSKIARSTYFNNNRTHPNTTLKLYLLWLTAEITLRSNLRQLNVQTFPVGACPQTPTLRCLFISISSYSFM